jgi:hypothetical protein
MPRFSRMVTGRQYSMKVKSIGSFFDNVSVIRNWGSTVEIKPITFFEVGGISRFTKLPQKFRDTSILKY